MHAGRCARPGGDGTPCDEIRTHPEARHIVVMARGLMYYFDVLDSKGLPCVSDVSLRENLGLIAADAKASVGEALGAQAALKIRLSENPGLGFDSFASLTNRIQIR